MMMMITDADCESRSDTSSCRGNWNHFKMIQKIPGQHTADSTNSRSYQKKKTATLGAAACTHTHAHTVREVLM